MKTNQKLLLMLFLLTMSLYSCQEEISNPIVETIKAIAGEDQAVKINTEVILIGESEGVSGSVQYEWTFKSKPLESESQIEDPNLPEARFTPDKTGEYVLELKASKGNLSDRDELKVTVSNQDPQEPNEPENPAVLSKDINEDLVLEDVHEDNAIPDYIVKAEIAVNAKLTVKPGVVIYFEENTGLIVNPQGIFEAKGLDSNRIIFTGKEARKGFWKGILFHSNSEYNKLENVLISYGGGGEFQEVPGIKANLILEGSSISASALNLKGSTIMESGGYGLYVKGKSQLTHFQDNFFSNNLSAAAYVPAMQLNRLNFHSSFNDNNGFNGIETGGELAHPSLVTWPAFNDGSKYLVSSDIIVKSGLKIMEGAIFEMKSDKMIQVEGAGYLDATGSEANRIVFTAYNKSTNGYWKGINFTTPSPNNKLIRSEVSYAGASKFQGYEKKGNVVVSGLLVARDSRFTFGLGYGIVAQQLDRINQDVASSNIFSNFTEGNVFPESMANPEAPSLAGDWVDYWSFTEELYTVDPKLYDRTNNVWFKGSADPWNIASQQGFGLKIAQNGKFIWTIAERHAFDPNCFSFSAEFITGAITATENQVTFNQDFWRSKFENSCDPEQNSDEEITPGDVPLKYEIIRVYDIFTGRPYWQLKFTNPDNSTFSYFRL